MKYFLFLFLFGSTRLEVQILDSDNFQEVALNKAKYVFVYFYSSSCVDCEDYSELMDQVAEIHKSRHNLIIAKADVGREIPEKMAELDTENTECRIFLDVLRCEIIWRSANL